jgi:KDO2-lipid IV(A) lauroyltransferase
MKFLGYIAVQGLLWLLHLLPDFLFYQVSNLFYLITYRIAGYRKKVVHDNLTRAFPEYDRDQIHTITRKFYRHLCDLLLESAVFPMFSTRRIMKKCRFRNLEILEPYYKEGKHIMAVTAHYNNWEYMTNIGLLTDYAILAIYKPLKNPWYDRQVQRNRNKYGVIPVPMEKVARRLLEYSRRKEPSMTFFLADQRPPFRQIQYWTKFMGRDTPVYLGTEKLARKMNAVVVFFKNYKVKRGHYEVELEVICEDPSTMDDHSITDAHVKILENLIREAPEHWLWSHRRWKHSYERYQQEKEQSA